MSLSETKELHGELLTARAKELIDGSYPASSLDFSIPQDAADFEAAVAAAPDAVLGRIRSDNEASMLLLKQWVEANPVNFLKLTREQHFPELIEIYFCNQLEVSAPADPKRCALTIHKSYDDFYCLDVRYATHEGEEIRYMDSQLKVPVTMSSKLQVRMKMYDIEKFISAMDITMDALSYRAVEQFVRDLLLSAYRNVMMLLLDKKEIGFYSLSRYYKVIANAVMTSFDNDFERIGVLVSDFQIRELTIPKRNVDNMERQCYAYRMLEQKCEYDRRRELMALEIYEKKAAIHAKYPDFPFGLTEAEKDFAMERYMKKMGISDAGDFVPDEIDKPALLKRKAAVDGIFPEKTLQRPVRPVAPVMPECPKVPRVGKGTALNVVTIVLTALLLIATFVAFVVGPTQTPLGSFLGFLFAGASVITIGCLSAQLLILYRHRIDNQPVTDAYRRDMKQYRSDVLLYKAQCQEYAASERQYQMQLAEFERKRRDAADDFTDSVDPTAEAFDEA